MWACAHVHAHMSTVEHVYFTLRLILLYNTRLLGSVHCCWVSCTVAVCTLLYQTGGGMGSARRCHMSIVVPYEVAGFCVLMLDAAVTLGVGLPGVIQ